MKYSASEVIQYIREQDIKFIRLSFCDIMGGHKNLAVMPYELERVFSYGMPIDPTAITGFESYGVSQLYLHPDPSTIAQLPWRPESGGVIRMYCSLTYDDGRPFEADCRRLLADSVQAAADRGLHFDFGTSMEFYLFKNDEDGKPTTIPHDEAGYMDIAPLDKGENVRREIQLNLEQMGIQPRSSHHEDGPGQNEIDFMSSDPVTSADNVVTFTSVVRTVAARNDLTADFSPKPVLELPGSGMHIGIAVRSDDGQDYLGSIAAGIMSKMSEITAFINPTDNSYERLGRNKAPRYISWSTGEHSHLMRMLRDPDGSRRAELRSPDSTANPYLAYTLILRAGMYGFDQRMQLMSSSNVNLYRAAVEDVEDFDKLPYTLEQARQTAKKSDFVRSVLPGKIIDFYCGK